MFTNARDYLSFYTHFYGIIFGVIGGIVMAIKGFHLGALVFCLSLIALYSASSIYHYYGYNKLRKFDHAMIYILIAGSYTPFCMEYMEGYGFLIFIWSFAFLGVIFKLCFINAPRWLGTAIYLLMGWSIVFNAAAFKSMESGLIFLIALGGIMYSIGAVIYIIKKPNLKRWGFHELFHLFILAGSLCHYLGIYIFVI